MKSGILIALSADQRGGLCLSQVRPLDELIKAFKKAVEKDLAPGKEYPILEVWTRGDGRVKTKRFDPAKGCVVDDLEEHLELESLEDAGETFAVQVSDDLIIQVASKEDAENLSVALQHAKQGLSEMDRLRKRIADLETLVALQTKTDKKPDDQAATEGSATADLLTTSETLAAAQPKEPATAPAKAGLAPKPPK